MGQIGFSVHVRSKGYGNLLYVIMGNVRSLPNKMGKLTALTWHQREYRECSIMVLRETWLTALDLDLDTNTNLEGFKLQRADMAENRKGKGGGLAVLMMDGVTVGTSLAPSHCCFSQGILQRFSTASSV